MEQTIFRFARAGNIDTNPAQFMQRAGTFAQAATEQGIATLLTRRTGNGMNGYLILPGKVGDTSAAIQLAQTVGARAEAEELPTDLGDSEAIGTLHYRTSPVMRETQAGIDPTELPRLLANSMPAGSWVAVTMRRPTSKERSRSNTWLANRLGTAIPTHHSVSPSAIAVTITAGGNSKQEVSALLGQVVSGMPGFDLDSSTVFASRRHRAVIGLPFGALLVAGLVFGLPHVPVEIASGLPAALICALWALAFACIVAGLASVTGKLSSADTKMRSLLDATLFRTPPTRRKKPRPPRKESIKRGSRTVNGVSVPFEKVIPASDGDYPMADDVFLLGPSVFVGMVSPHAGAISGEKVTRARAVPPAMASRIGPMLGYESGNPAYLSANDAFSGTAVLGVPNSGKSLLIRSIFGWHCLERTSPSGGLGFPGRNNTLIAFESKGDGVDKYLDWAHGVGDSALAIDVSDPQSRAIDMFAVPGDNAQRASFFVNAMVYAFGETAIGDRSFATLTAVLTAALAVNDELLDSMDLSEDQRHLLPNSRSPLYYAYVLLGGYSDTAGVDLASGLKTASVKLRSRGTPNADLDQAYSAIGFLYDGKTESNRRTFQEAPRSKVSQLLAIGSWWEPTRPKATWDQILNGHRSIIINTGSSPTGRILDDSQNQQISSMLMYSMQNAIKRCCSGWQSERRYVSIFADELSLLAGNSPEVLGWLRDQGRSFGIRPFLATQRPEQLPSALRNNLLTYGTLISFAQSDVATANEVAANMGSAGEWSQDDIQHLEPYHVLVRSHVEQRRQSAFIVKLPNFEADIAGYPAVQGYAAAATVPSLIKKANP